jgi:hypothetical protein
LSGGDLCDEQNLLTPRYSVFLKQLKVVQLVKKSNALMASKHFLTMFISTSPCCREEVRGQSEDIDVHVRIILKYILKKQEAKCDCTDLVQYSDELQADLVQYSDELQADLVQYSDELQADFQRCDGLSGRIKGGEFLIRWVTISFRRRTPSSSEPVRARFVPRSAHACCILE